MLSKEGISIEVKTSAYLQSWDQQSLSKISFDIQPIYGWDSVTNEYDAEKKRQSDVYVFCVLKHKDQATLNPLDLSQWDFYERSNRILHAYLGDRNNTMKMHAELLSRILNYPVSIVLYQDDQKILFGSPFPYVEEYCDNLISIKPFMLVTSQNYPVMTFPEGFLVWHNPNYILSLDEDLLYTAASQIALINKSLNIVEGLNIDVVTGLFSRKHLIHCLEAELARAVRHNLYFTVLIMRVDEYAAYREAYGHQEADKVLKIVAGMLNENFRKEAIRARYSEDKFCIVIPQCKDCKIEKIQSLFHLRLKPPLIQRPVTISIGAAVYPESATEAGKLLNVADNRLYKTKIRAAGV
jgi:diguanylate cyclase (GGDEF)-like protein